MDRLPRVFCHLRSFTVPKATYDGNRQGQDELSDKNLDREQVHQAFDTTLLVVTLLRVHHDTGFTACVYHKTDDPLGIHQLSTFEQELFLVE